MTGTVALVVEYDGSRYAGFQYQPVLPTIQGELERAIRLLTGTQTRIRGAGRTDAGVHSTGQVVAFDIDKDLDYGRLAPGLNYYLPSDISVVSSSHARIGFDPRREAVSRTYRYTFLERLSRSPLRDRFTNRVTRILDIDAMQQSMSYLVGTRNFAPFCGKLPPGKGAVRHIFRADVWREMDEVHLELEGNAFLPQQVRRIAGQALDIGLGKMTLEAFEDLADLGDHGAAANVLPPKGLCLRQINYGDVSAESYAVTTDNKTYSGR